MRVSSLITLGMVTIALSVGAGGGGIVLREAANRAIAVDGAGAAAVTQATLAAETKLLDERAATREAVALEGSRSATDAAFDAVSRAVRSSDVAWGREIPDRLAAVRLHLAALRRRADALLAKPAADRSGADLRQVASDMTAVVAEFSPVLDIAEATLARADPNAARLATTARVATEMRDYAGRLGLALTPLGRSPATDAGRLEALIEQLRRFFGRPSRGPDAEEALAETERQFGEAVERGGFNDGSAGGRAGFSAVLQLAGKLADRALAELTERMQAGVAERSGSLRFAALALALILAVIGVIYWLMRARISQPLAVASDATQRLARGELDVTIPARATADEIGTIAKGLDVFRAALGEKARTAAWARALEGTTRQLSAELRSAREAASRTKAGFRAMLRQDIGIATAPARTPLPDDVLELPSEMIIEDDALFDPARASSGGGKDRLDGYIVVAAFLNGCIRDSIEADDRAALKAAARRLSDTSRTAGAIRIGMLARTLDEVALQADPARLVDLEKDIVAAFNLTSAEIQRVAASLT